MPLNKRHLHMFCKTASGSLTFFTASEIEVHGFFSGGGFLGKDNVQDGDGEENDDAGHRRR